MIALCFLCSDSPNKSKYKNSAKYLILENIIKNIDRSKFDIYVLYDNYNNISLKNIINTNNIYKFDFNSLITKYNSKVFDNYLYVGNCHLPLIDFMYSHNEYDGYLFYESDLFISKNAFTIINNIDYNNYDCILQNKRHKTNDAKHWLETTKNIPIKYLNNYYHGLYNIYYISKKTLTNFHKYIKYNNYYGHHEILYNIYLLNNNLKINYLSNFLDVYTYYIDNHFDNKFNAYIKNICTDTFIMHPCKSVQNFNKLINYI